MIKQDIQTSVSKGNENQCYVSIVTVFSLMPVDDPKWKITLEEMIKASPAGGPESPKYSGEP